MAAERSTSHSVRRANVFSFVLIAIQKSFHGTHRNRIEAEFSRERIWQRAPALLPSQPPQNTESSLCLICILRTRRFEAECPPNSNRQIRLVTTHREQLYLYSNALLVRYLRAGITSEVVPGSARRLRSVAIHTYLSQAAPVRSAAQQTPTLHFRLRIYYESHPAEISCYVSRNHFSHTPSASIFAPPAPPTLALMLNPKRLSGRLFAFRTGEV